MTCEDVARNETVEKYLLDQLDDDARESFEEHYFGCGRCFGLLQTFRGLQDELARTREAALLEAPRSSWVWRWAWAPAMAVLFIAVSIGLWQRPLQEVSTPPPGEASPMASVPQPGTPEPPPVPPAAPPQPSLADLARVEPPAYTPGRLRGAADEATARFQEAMTEYRRGNYAAAIAGLRRASRLDPQAPHIAFFLGVSQLLAGERDAAIGALGRTIALGESPYLEEAHFYLAKAHLQAGNVDEARRELDRTIRLRGEHGKAARAILDQLDSISRSPR
jgi:tetratricopeptide (TPR) repeat protein